MAAALLILSVGMLPARAAAVSPEVGVSATAGPYTRDSFYVGGTMGGAFGFGATDWHGYGFNGTQAQALANKGSSSVLEAGLLAGYQHRLESVPVMVGVEAAINYLGNRRSNNLITYVNNTPPAPVGTYYLHSGSLACCIALRRWKCGRVRLFRCLMTCGPCCLTILRASAYSLRVIQDSPNRLATALLEFACATGHARL